MIGEDALDWTAPATVRGKLYWPPPPQPPPLPKPPSCPPEKLHPTRRKGVRTSSGHLWTSIFECFSPASIKNDGKDQREFLEAKEQPQELSKSPEFTPLRIRCVIWCVKIFPKSAKID